MRLTQKPSKGHLYICLAGLEGPGELLGEGALTTAMAQGSWRMDEFGSILSEIAGIGGMDLEGGRCEATTSSASSSSRLSSSSKTFFLLLGDSVAADSQDFCFVRCSLSALSTLLLTSRWTLSSTAAAIFLSYSSASASAKTFCASAFFLIFLCLSASSSLFDILMW